MSIIDLRFRGEPAASANPLRRLADHYPIPFLTGTDGLTWRERKVSAERYADAVAVSPTELAQIRTRLAALSTEHRNTT